MPEETPTTTTDQKLEAILEHLQNMDRRDRIRTWGGFVRGVISIVPVFVLLWSVWYTYEHGAELLEMISKQAAKQAAEVTKDSALNMQERFQEYFPTK